MGIWSECIYVYPGDEIVDLSKINKKALEQLSHSGFFNKYLDCSNPTEDKNLSKVSLEEIKSECYDTAKIYGYLDENELNGWNEFLIGLSKQIPNKNIEFHFYCSDEKLPYYFQYNHEDQIVYLYKGQRNHICYFDANYEYDENNNIKSIQTSFNLAKYINNYKAIHYGEWDRRSMGSKIFCQQLFNFL
jgi:hypothetical protein